MDDTVHDVPLASFEAKWADAHPEFQLALPFVPAPLRPAYAAFSESRS